MKRQTLKYNQLMKRVEAANKQNSNLVTNSNPRTATTIDSGTGNGFAITPATEKRLLQQLKQLEQKEFYLKKDITLASLTSELNSNTRYVSQVIKTHKNKDFNNYINELRIFHVIRLWSENPKYLKYKLTYIADQVGFASHSRFSLVFKNITGLTPSAFLAQLEKEKE